MKKIDVSVFAGQNFDCEFLDRFDRWNNVFTLDHVFQSDSFTGYYINKEIHWKQCRPRLNHWHFNDGSMVLPDGLVVESFESDGVVKKSRSEDLKSLHHRYYPPMSKDDPRLLAAETVLGVKILGVTSQHREHGEELGMQVVEL